MSHGLLRVAAIGAVIVLAGCSGSGGSTGAAAAPTAGATTAAPPAISDAGATGGATSAGPTAAPAVADPSSGAGGGTPGSVCALVSDAELGGILGVAVKTAVISGPPDTCDIQTTDGAPLAAFQLTTIGAAAASAVYDAFASAPGATSFSGIGEKAAYDPGQASMVVLKNGAVLAIQVLDDATKDEAARIEMMKKIGSVAAGRL